MRFNERYGRITHNFLSVYGPYAGPDLTVSVTHGSRLSDAIDRYNELKVWIDFNIDSATHGDLSKLATAAKRILIEIAKRECWKHQWDASNKILTIKDSTLDFS